MSTARPPSSSVAPYRSVTRSRAGRRKRTERPKSPWSAWVRKRQYWTVHGRSRPRWARTSSMSAFEASAGIMIWIGSPESLTSAKTTTDTPKIEPTDWTTRPMMKRCIGASALEELDRPRQGHQEDAAALARRRVLDVGRRVEIVAGLQVLAPDLKIALDDEDLLAGRMVVGGKARAGLEPHERGGSAGVLVVAEDFDGSAACRQDTPPDVLAPKRRRRTSRLGHISCAPRALWSRSVRLRPAPRTWPRPRSDGSRWSRRTSRIRNRRPR